MESVSSAAWAGRILSGIDDEHFRWPTRPDEPHPEQLLQQGGERSSVISARADVLGIRKHYVVENQNSGVDDETALKLRRL